MSFQKKNNSKGHPAHWNKHVIQPTLASLIQRKPEPATKNVQLSKNTFGEPAIFPPKKSVQAKMNVGTPGDSFEKEADTTAETVVQRTEASKVQEPSAKLQISRVPTSNLQRMGNGSETEGKENVQLQSNSTTQLKTEEENGVQMKAVAIQNATGNSSSSVESTIASSKGGGSHMDKKTKNEMESGFGTDFSKVKIHTDSKAIQMSRELGAHAFTNGSDIYFNQGKYDPSSRSGKHLLAHELTHTVQQRGGNSQKQVQLQTDGSQQGGGKKTLDPLKEQEFKALNLTKKQKAQFKATVLAETSHGLSGLHDIAWIYFSRITDNGWSSAMNGSTAFKQKNENYKLWMYYQGEGSEYKDYNYRGEGKLSDYVTKNQWFTGKIEPRAKSYMKWMDDNVFAEHPKHKYKGWHGQGYWGDINKNPSDGKGDQWYQARQYYLLQVEGKVSKQYVVMLEELNGDGRIKDQTSFIFDEDAIAKYFTDNPKMLPKPENVKKYTYGEGKQFKR